MADLVLSLAPNERVLINGALIENGDRRTRISVLSDAKILRLKNAILPEDAGKSPLHKAIFYLQTLSSGEGKHSKQLFAELLIQVKQFLSLDPEISRRWTRQFGQDEYYQISKEMRSYLPKVEGRLNT